MYALKNYEKFLKEFQSWSKEKQDEFIKFSNDIDKEYEFKNMKPIVEGLNPQEIVIRGYVTDDEYDLIEKNKLFFKANVIGDCDERESLWVAIFTQKDKEYYDKNYCGDFLAVLCNDSFLLGESGKVIKGHFRGEERPVFYVKENLLEQK